MKRMDNSEKKDTIIFYDKLHIKVLDYFEFQNSARKRSMLHRLLDSKIEASLYKVESIEDDISQHFCFRLLSAQSHWSALQFIKNEGFIFEKRINRFDISTVRKFFFEKFLGHLTNTKIDKNKKEIRIYQKAVYTHTLQNDISDAKGYIIYMYFTHVIDLVQSRDVEVAEGFVLGDEKTYKTIISNIFRKFVNEKTISLYFKCKQDQDERLIKMYENIYIPDVRQADNSPLLKKDEQFFPPCISGLIAKLKKVGHLKYKDRLVLARFFKDSGMAVDDCVQFFRNNFRISKEVFDKEYLYSIRHTFGLEGKRANYHAFSCAQMVSAYKDRSAFGCPFRNKQEYIGHYTKEKKLEEPVIVEIEDLVKKWKCQEACTVLLGGVTGEIISENEIVSTPINFFNRYRDKTSKKNENVNK